MKPGQWEDPCMISPPKLLSLKEVLSISVTVLEIQMPEKDRSAT